MLAALFSFTSGLNDAINFGASRGLNRDITVSGFFFNIAQFLTTFIVSAALAVIIFGALMYILALGDESRLARAKRIILFSLIGLIIGMVGFVGVAVVCEITGASGSDCATVMSWLQIGGETKTPGEFIAALLSRAADIILQFIAAAALLAIIWGAVMYITSLGDESRVAQAKRIILYSVIGMIIAIAFEFFLALACEITGFTEEACSGIPDTSELVVNLMNAASIILSLLSILAVGAIVYGAYLYITSQGQEDKAAQGKRVILYAALGLIIATLSAVIVNVVINVVSA